MSSSLFPILVGSLLKGTVILCCAYILTRLVFRMSSAERHFIWVLSFLSLLLLPVLTLLVPKISVPIGLAADVEKISQQANMGLVGDSKPDAVQPLGARALPESVNAKTQGTDIILLCLAIYFILVFFLVARQLGLVWFVQRSLTPLPELDETDSKTLLSSLSATFGINRHIRLLLHHSDITPWTWGVLSPVIVLPKNFLSWSEQDRRNALMHELAHIQRFDVLSAVLSRIVCALYWLNPLVWYFYKKMINEAEKSCDDTVILQGAKSSHYADQLLSLAQHVYQDRDRLNTVAAMAVSGPLSYRIKSILNSGLRRNAMNKLKILITTIIVGFVLLPFVVLQAETKRVINELGDTQDRDYLPMLKITSKYPKEQFEKGVEGRVVLEFDVTEQGFVENLKVIESVPQGAFDKSAIDSVSKYIYLPKIKNGVPVRTTGVRNQIRFKLGTSPTVVVDEEKFQYLDKNGPGSDEEMKELVTMYQAKAMHAKATSMIGEKILQDKRIDPAKFELLNESILAEKSSFDWELKSKSTIRSLESRARNEESSDLYVELAKLYLNLNSTREARGYIMQAYRLNNFTDANNARKVLARVLAETGHYSEAIAVYRKIFRDDGISLKEQQSAARSIQSLQTKMAENQALGVILNKAENEL